MTAVEAQPGSVQSGRRGTTRLQIEVEATPADVWAVLVDPPSYPEFVPGAKYERDHDPGWPEPGAKLHHTIGIGPFVQRDCTNVEGFETESSLLLQAGMGVLGASMVRFTLQRSDAGRTWVGIEEWPVRGLVERFWNRGFDAAMTARNQELLRRLQRLVESRVSSR